MSLGCFSKVKGIFEAAAAVDEKRVLHVIQAAKLAESVNAPNWIVLSMLMYDIGWMYGVKIANAQSEKSRKDAVFAVNWEQEFFSTNNFPPLIRMIVGYQKHLRIMLGLLMPDYNDHFASSTAEVASSPEDMQIIVENFEMFACCRAIFDMTEDVELFKTEDVKDFQTLFDFSHDKTFNACWQEEVGDKFATKFGVHSFIDLLKDNDTTGKE
jgi:predicted HD phosphohydrolase